MKTFASVVFLFGTVFALKTIHSKNQNARKRKPGTAEQAFLILFSIHAAECKKSRAPFFLEKTFYEFAAPGEGGKLGIQSPLSGYLHIDMPLYVFAYA